VFSCGKAREVGLVAFFPFLFLFLGECRGGGTNGDDGIECEVFELAVQFLGRGERGGFSGEWGEGFYEARVPGRVGFEVEELDGVGLVGFRGK
jgi:hypothetical protein